MARFPVRRQPKWYDITTFRLGLVTDTDYLIGNINSARLLQNARTRKGRIVKRNGSLWYSPALANSRNSRCSGVHQWYPATATDENFVYASVGGNIIRLAWDSTSVDPPTKALTMTFSDGASWPVTESACFVDFNDFCFAFNGISPGAQMIRTATESMYQFGIAKMAAPTVITAGTGGLIAAGTYKYAVRAVREEKERVREYWGALSDEFTVGTSGATSANTVTWTATNDPQVTHYYIYRTLANLNTLYYLARVAVGTTTYTDTSAAPSSEKDDDGYILDRIPNIAYAASDDGVLFAVALDASGTWVWYNSNAGRPQEFPEFNNGDISDGSGRVTGVFAFAGYVWVFREHGIIGYQRNTSNTYDRVAYIAGYGCIAPWSVKVIAAGSKNFVTFADEKEGPCLLRADGSVETLKRRKYSDVVDFFDNQIDPNYRKYISVGYKKGYIYWSWTPIGSTYNIKCLVFDTANDSWLGPDVGYAAGPMFCRKSGDGVFGNGELIAAYDNDAVRLFQIDAPTSQDFASHVILQVDSMAIAADWLPQEVEFQEVALYARLSNAFRFDVAVTSENYSQSYYIAPSAKIYMDDGTLFDSGATFDEALQSLFDSTYFDQGDVFDTMRDLPYTIELDSCSCQGAYLIISLYDALSYSYEIARLRILAVMRGER